MSSIEADTDTSPPPTLRNLRFAMAGDSSLPESYHLDGGGNFGMWAYRMKSLLQKDRRFHYCTTPPRKDMSEEERLARQQVMSVISSNVKNSALKLLRRYDDPYECWTGLKSRYESDSGPRRVMLLEKFFALRKTDSVSMDAHLTEVREVANLLEEVEVNIPEDVIVFYTLKNLPKEYEIFKRMQIAAQKLPTYEQLEAKLISEETALKMENQKEDGEALFVHRDRNRRPQFGSAPRPHHPQSQNNSRSAQSSRWRSDSGGFSGTRSFSQEDQGSPSRPPQPLATSNQRSATSTQFQPRYRNRGPERPRNGKCNFCGLVGHFERECDLRSILDRLKDYEHRLNEQRQRNLSGQIHHLEEPSESFSQDLSQNDEETADQIVDACLIELNLSILSCIPLGLPRICLALVLSLTKTKSLSLSLLVALYSTIPLSSLKLLPQENVTMASTDSRVFHLIQKSIWSIGIRRQNYGTSALVIFMPRACNACLTTEQSADSLPYISLGIHALGAN